MTPLVAAAQSVAASDADTVLTSIEIQAEEPDDIAGWEAAVPEDDPNEPPINWVDTSHAALTDRAQRMTEWMDGFFGDSEYILEQPESQLRLEFVDKHETDRGNDFKVRLRGKLQLPQISERLDIVFNGEESELDSEEDRESSGDGGLQLQLGDIREDKRSRFDLTMGFSSSHLRPGVKYRNQGSFDDRHSYRFLQRLQYEHGENFYSISQLDLNRSIDEDSILRWGNKIIYGEKTEGVEWRTGLTLRQRLYPESTRPVAINYFAGVNGVTREKEYVKNYRLGFRWRRQVYRDYLFMEIEPSYNYIRREYEDKRNSVLGIILRLEFALERDLRRVKSSEAAPETEPAPGI
ncbi:hypothetical protein N9M39_00845 [Halieaceae bacterium]|nr:hypothetical protein [Halieaceae bacterium]